MVVLADIHLLFIYGLSEVEAPAPPRHQNEGGEKQGSPLRLHADVQIDEEDQASHSYATRCMSGRRSSVAFKSSSINDYSGNGNFDSVDGSNFSSIKECQRQLHQLITAAVVNISFLVTAATTARQQLFRVSMQCMHKHR